LFESGITDFVWLSKKTTFAPSYAAQLLEFPISFEILICAGNKLFCVSYIPNTFRFGKILITSPGLEEGGGLG